MLKKNKANKKNRPKAELNLFSISLSLPLFHPPFHAGLF